MDAFNINDPPVNPVSPSMAVYFSLQKKLRAKKRAQLELFMTAERRKDVTDLLMEAISSSTVLYRRSYVIVRSISDKELIAKRLEGEIFQLADTVANYHRILAARKWEIEMVDAWAHNLIGSRQ